MVFIPVVFVAVAPMAFAVTVVPVFAVLLVMRVAAAMVFMVAFLHLHPLFTCVFFTHFTLHHCILQPLCVFCFLDAYPPHPGFFLGQHAIADCLFELGRKFFFLKRIPGSPGLFFAHLTPHDRRAQFSSHFFKFLLHFGAEIFVVRSIVIPCIFMEQFHHVGCLLERKFAFDHTLGQSLLDRLEVLGEGIAEREYDQAEEHGGQSQGA